MQTDRLNIRLSRGEKAAIRTAARIDRKTLSTFVLTAAMDRAVIVQFSQPIKGRGNRKAKR